MARGWESKDVEWQQQRAEEERAARSRTVAPLTSEERRRLERRRTLELALARARADFGSASQPAHRELLTNTIEALEKALVGLGPPAELS